MSDEPVFAKHVNLETEQSLLGALLVDPDVMIACSAAQLLPQDFYREAHAVIYAEMQRQYEQRRGFDVVTVRDGLGDTAAQVGGLLYLSELSVNSGVPIYGDHYAQTLKRLSYNRRAIQFGSEAVKRSAAAVDPSELFGWIQDQVRAMTPPSTIADNVLYGPNDIADYAVLLNELESEFKAGLVREFAWPEAWRNTWGRHVRPLRRGMVGIIGALSGMGKTTYLQCIAEAWAKQEYQTVYVHWEDSQEDLRHRRMARWSGVPLERLEIGDFRTEDWRAIEDAESRMSKWVRNVHHLGAAGFSMSQVIAELVRLNRDGRCDAVVADYLDKAQPDARQTKLFAGNPWERQADDMEQLKIFAEQHHVAVMTASQGNKDMSNGYGRAGIQGSGQRVHKVQLVVIFQRDLISESEATPTAPAGSYSPVVRVRVDKQNRGQTCSFEQYIDGPRFRVADITPDSKEHRRK